MHRRYCGSVSSAEVAAMSQGEDVLSLDGQWKPTVNPGTV